MPKLITRIFGGLGNQLFIYATAKALAARTGAELVLDTKTGFRRDAYQRQFALHRFDIQYREANALEQFDFPAGKIARFMLRRANRHLPFRHRFYLTEKKHTERFPKVDNFLKTGCSKRYFMPELMSFQPAGRTWLEGYWQSPRYFENIRETLTHELTVQGQLSPETMRVAAQIQTSDSVCVHLRLSRNIVAGKEIATGKQLDWQHYIQCMDFVAQQIENPRFFCFSDNPEAAQKLGSLPYDIVLVSHNKGDERAHEDFYLMSLCRHFILSNSTFGWWPAWLNTNPGSMVISPPVHFWDNRDILPSGWVTSDQLSERTSDAPV